MVVNIGCLIVLSVFGFIVIRCDDSIDYLQSNNQLYKEMGCIPAAKDENGRALSYNCNHLNTRDNRNKCYYNNKVYSIHESIIADDNIDPCLAACFCEYNEYSKATKFTCAQVECPSHFGFGLEPGCYYKYTLDLCCGQKYCPKRGEKANTCLYQGRSYIEGGIIYDNNKRCICTSDFNGTLKDEHCGEIRCKYELLYNTYLLEHRNCAPVYYNTNDGCPIEWICYNETGTPESIADTEDVKLTLPEESVTGKSVPIMKCKLGPLQLHFGQKLKTSENNKCVECSCKVPPYLTCIKDEKCDLNTQH